jgi:hypothetical protein
MNSYEIIRIRSLLVEALSKENNLVAKDTLRKLDGRSYQEQALLILEEHPHLRKILLKREEVATYDR